MKESLEGHGMNGESVINTGKNHVNTNIENKVAKLCKVLFRDGCMYYKATDKKMEYSESRWWSSWREQD